MKHIYTALFLFLFSGVTQADQWLCITDMSAGFIYRDGRSGQVNFNTEDEIFIFRRVKDDEEVYRFTLKAKWVAIKIGTNWPFTWCKVDF